MSIQNSYYDSVSSKSPKVWYRFDETAGTPGNLGSLSNSLTTTGTPLLNENTDVDGRSVYFNGSSYYTLSNTSDFTIFNDKSFSIELWFKTNTTLTNTDNFFTLFDITNGLSSGSLARFHAYILGTNKLYPKGNLVFSFSTNGINDEYIYPHYNNPSSTTFVNNNQWHHLVIASNTTSIKFYLDGGIINTVDMSGGSYPASLNLDSIGTKRIGANRDGANFFNGWLDEVALYDFELSAAQVNQNYVAGTAVYVNDIVATVSALMLQPVISASFNPAAQAPMTASAASGDHYNSTVTFPTLLDTYMSTLTLQSWFKFDKNRVLTNYGTEATRSSIWNNGVTNNPTGGVQGSGELKLVMVGALNPYITQQVAAGTGEVALLNDEDFTIGFWTKKLDKPTNYNSFILSAYKNDNTQGVNFQYNTDGGISFVITHNNTNHTVTSATDITDGEWHFVVGKLSSNTMQMWIDGTSIGTTSMTHNLTLDSFNFDGASSTDTTSVSQFFIATASAIGTTEIANMWDYGTPSILQGAAYMPEANAKFNSAFNDYIQSKNPVIDYRLDEAAGSPVNYGTASLALVPYLSPQGFTQNEPGLNTRGFKFTSRDQTTRGNYAFDTGTFSTDDICTIGVLFKNADATNQQGFIGFGGRLTNPADGNGFSLQMLASSGYLRIIAGNGNGTATNYTGTTNYADNKWHLAVIVKSASTVKLYVDGKEHITGSCTTAMTDTGEFIIGGLAGIVASATARDTLIDEAFVTNTAFTAQEAFEAWQALRLEMETTATALMVQPATILGTGNIVLANAMTTSTLFVMPSLSLGVSKAADPANSSSQFLHPNYGTTVVQDSNYGQSSATASALFHMPQLQIGELNTVDHMDASALMIHPISAGGGSISVPSATALDATLVMPTLITIKGARAFASPMNSNAIFPLPPQYLQLSDDDWYLRLYGAHFDGAREPIQGTLGNLPNQSSTSAISGGFLTFFDDVVVDMTPTTTVNDIESELGQFAFIEPDEYSYDDAGDLIPLKTDGNMARATATRQSNTPQAILSTGLYDPYERKAVRITNLEFPFPGTDKNWSERPYNIEFSIKTNKSDQILTHGFWSSYIYYGRKIGVIGLSDGQIYLTEDSYTPSSFTFRQGVSGSITAPHPKNFINRAQYLLGRKNIADGKWHHVVIQQGWRSEKYRTQIWIDGQLDKQIITPNSSMPGFDGSNTIRPYILGFNSNDELLYSDFETSAWNFYPGRFLDTRNINLNYTAYQKSKPIKVKPMTASADATQDHLAQGNRSRALLLYWWPKTSAGITYYPSRVSNQGYLSTFDSNVTTQDSKFTPPQDYQGWDIFPISVIGDFKGSGSDIIKNTTLLVDDAYRNEITGARRYLDVVKDLDLTQIDAIFFANYPEDSKDLDSYVREEYADEYFQLKEVTLYEDFLKSLRAAVDKGLSLFVTNEKLAVDLKIINKAETVTIFNELVSNDTDFSDFRAPVLTGRTAFDEGLNKFIYNEPDDAFDPVQPVSSGGSAAYWHDTFNNMRHRVINTEMFLTDDATYIHTDQANYQHSDTIDFGGVDRHYNRFEYKMNGLQPGDEFIFGNFRDKTYLGNSRPRQGTSIRAIPFEHVNAGKIITAQPLNYWKKNTLTPNPYANYAHSIAINENDVLDGRPVGGKIFVCFSEVFWDRTDEYFKVDLIQDYWINIAFDNGLINEAERDKLKSGGVYLGPDSSTENERTRTKKYWSYNGDYNFMQQLSSDAYVGILGFLFDDDQKIAKVSSTRKGLPSATRARDKLGRFASGTGVGSGGGLPFAQFITGHGAPTMNVYVPSLLTRAFWWLSDRIRPTGLVYRSEAMTVNATMPNGLARPDKAVSVNAAAMISNATIGNVFQSTLKSVSILVLPLTATATIVQLGKNILASPMIAVSSVLNHGVITFGEDPIILKIYNIEPVLYIRGAKTT